MVPEGKKKGWLRGTVFYRIFTSTFPRWQQHPANFMKQFHIHQITGDPGHLPWAKPHGGEMGGMVN